MQIGKISRFGLLELSRQRLRPALGEGSHITCPRCNGTGHIRDTESTALQILRIIQEEAMKENTGAVHRAGAGRGRRLPAQREARRDHEDRDALKVTVLLVPNRHLETPNYRVERLRHDDLNQAEPLPASFKMVERPERDRTVTAAKEEAKEPRQEAVVKGITPSQPAPSAPVKQHRRSGRSLSGATDARNRQRWLAVAQCCTGSAHPQHRRPQRPRSLHRRRLRSSVRATRVRRAVARARAMDVRRAATAGAMALRPVETTVAPTGIAAMGVPADRPPMVSDRAPVVTASLAKVAKTTTCAKARKGEQREGRKDGARRERPAKEQREGRPAQPASPRPPRESTKREPKEDVVEVDATACRRRCCRSLTGRGGGRRRAARRR